MLAFRAHSFGWQSDVCLQRGLHIDSFLVHGHGFMGFERDVFLSCIIVVVLLS